MKKKNLTRVFAVAVVLAAMGNYSAQAADGTWIGNAVTNNWSDPAKWSGGTTADGAGATGNFTFNITNNRTATIDATSRSLGILNIGDSDGIHSYTIAASGGASLIFNNSGSAAQLNALSTGLNTTISAPVLLNDSLNINNATSTGVVTISGTVTGNNTGTQTITNQGSGAGTVVISGIIADGGGGKVAINQNSSTSSLTLNGANTFTGDVTLTSGVLRTNSNQVGAFGAGASQMFLNGGELQLVGTGANNTSRQYNRNTTVGGDVAVTLDRSNGTGANYTFGTLSIGTNTLTVQAGSTVSPNAVAMGLIYGATTQTGAAVFAVNNGTASTSKLTLASLNKAGFDTTFSGTGQVVISGDITGAGNIVNNASKLSVGSDTVAFTLANNISGSGDLVKEGSETLTLSGANTFTGNVTMASASTLKVSADNNLGAGTTINMRQNAILNTTASFSTSKNIVFAAGGANQDINVDAGTTLTLNGVLSGGAGGSWRITGAGTVELNAVNTTSADLTVTSNVKITGSGTFGDGTGDLSINSATADLGGTSQTVGALSLVGTSSTLSNGTITATSYAVNNTSGVVNVSAVLAGSGVTFTKINAGTVTLSAANTYTGTTTVSAGTLIINGSTSASSAVSVDSGATLGGNGTIGGNVTVAGNLNPGNSPGILTVDGDLTLQSTAATTMEITGTTSGTFDQVIGINAMTLDGALVLSLTGTYGVASWDLFDFTSESGNFASVTLSGSYSGTLSRTGDLWTGNVGGQDWTFSQLTGGLSVVPEPSTWVLLAGGLTVTMVLRRRRNA